MRNHLSDGPESRAEPTPEPRPEPRPALRSVAVVIDHGVSMFELAIPCEVFGIDRTDDGIPPFEFSICSPTPGPVRTSIGFHVVPTHDLSPLETADLVIVPPLGVDDGGAVDACLVPHASPAVDEALRRVIARGGRVASLCSGAFILGRAGLLDGRRATTHWYHADAFEDEFPEIELACDVLYVEDGQVVTSAGTAAGIDMCLHLVRQAHGAEAANGIARRMVVPPQRDGGQAQYVRTPVREAPARTLAPVLDWARARLHEDLSVTRLARQAVMSERTFARRFRDETGTTPHQWVQRERIALAEQLLESGDLAIEEVARLSGFGSAAMLRHHFGRRRRTTPGNYRRTFSTSTPVPRPVSTAG